MEIYKCLISLTICQNFTNLKNIHTKFDRQAVSRTGPSLRERVSPAEKRSSYSSADCDHRTGCDPRPPALLVGPSRCWIPSLVYLGITIGWVDIRSGQIQNSRAIQPKSRTGNSHQHADAAARRTSVEHQTSTRILTSRLRINRNLFIALIVAYPLDRSSPLQ
jgi:hypothetical protein